MKRRRSTFTGPSGEIIDPLHLIHSIYTLAATVQHLTPVILPCDLVRGTDKSVTFCSARSINPNIHFFGALGGIWRELHTERTWDSKGLHPGPLCCKQCNSANDWAMMVPMTKTWKSASRRQLDKKYFCLIVSLLLDSEKTVWFSRLKLLRGVLTVG